MQIYRRPLWNVALCNSKPMDYPWLHNEENPLGSTPPHIHYSNACQAVLLLYMHVLEYSRAKKRREEKPTRCHWMVYCTYNMLNMFQAFYAHHQELKTICVLLLPMVCSAWLLVVGGQVQGSRLCVQEKGCCTNATSLFLLPCTWPPTTSNQELHTIGGNNTHIVSSSWCWA